MLLKPENFALLGVMAVYLLHWLLVPVAMREAFFGCWLPLLSYGHGVYNVSYREVAQTILGSPISLVGVAAALAAALLCLRGRPRLRHHLVALAALADLALVLIFSGATGASCRRIPLDVAGLLCLALLVAEGNWQWAVGRRQSATAWGVGGGEPVLGLFVAVWFGHRKEHAPDPPRGPRARRDRPAAEPTGRPRVGGVHLGRARVSAVAANRPPARAAVISIRFQSLCFTRA